MIFSSKTNSGYKKNKNQDYIKHINKNLLSLFVVCDGISIYKNSDIASKNAAEIIINFFLKPFNDPIEHLIKSFNYAHKKIINNGTTAAAVYIMKNQAFISWCGDSRIYFFHKNKIKWLSRDHNIIHDVLNKGKSKGHIYENPKALTRYLGCKQSYKPDTHIQKIENNDKILICTDGLSDFIMENDLIKIINKYNVKNASDILEKKLLSKEINAPDNFSWYLIKL